MKIKIKGNKTFYLTIYFVLFVVLVGIAMGMPAEKNTVIFVGLIALLNIIWTEWLCYCYMGTLVTYANLFLACLHLFHFGQIVINFFDISHVYRSLDILEVLGYEEYLQSACYAILFSVFCVLGVMLQSVSILTGGKINRRNDKASNRKLFLIGIILTILSLPIHIRISLLQVRLTTEGNYLNSFEANISGIQYTFSMFCIIGIIMLMLAFSEQRIKLYLIYFLSIIYFAWTMMSGGRGRPVITILLFTFILLKLVKVSPWKIVLLAAAGYIALMALSAIARIRDYGGITVENLYHAMKMGGSPIIAALEEFGGTQQTVGLAVRLAKSCPYKLGSTYFLSLFSILPNAGGIFSNLNQESIFTLYLPGAYLGGSIIGEAYYNFGWLGCGIGMAAGLLIGRLSSKIECIFRDRKYDKIAYYVMPCFGILWWVRDAFNSILRNTIWAWVIIYFLYLLYHYIFVGNHVYRGMKTGECANKAQK